MRPVTISKPWGKFEEFTLNQPSTVKILTIFQGEEFSLQYHNDREEYWRILSGNPEIHLGERIIRAKPGDEFDIFPQVSHRVRALYDNVEVLEVSLGSFSEDDIIRLEDKYNRS